MSLDGTAIIERTFAAFLFDMDGTVLDSISIANRIWTGWANRHGLDADEVLAAMHGVQVVQTMRRFAHAGFDVDREAAYLTRAEIDAVDGITEIAGAKRLLSALPLARWAIVTSAPRALAIARLNAAGLPLPAVLITAEDVAKGKPAPDCYLAAASTLGVPIADCLVWEDAPAGIQAGEAAGASVVVMASAHAAPVQISHPQLRNYEDLSLHVEADGRLRLTELR